MAKLSWDSLEKTYHSWRAPTAKVSVGANVLNRWRIDSVECDTGVEISAGACSVVLKDVYDHKNTCFTCEDVLILGSPVRIELGYIVTKPVFYGYLYSVEYCMSEEEEPTATLLCMDVKGAMMGAGLLDVTGSTTYKQAIKSMFSGKYARGYQVLCTAPAMAEPCLDRKLSFLPDQMDDYTFLTATARRFGLECFVREGKLLLRKTPPLSTPILELSGDQLRSLRCEFSSVGYVRTVTIYGGTDSERDSDKKRARGQAKNPVRLAPDASDAGRLLGQRGIELFVSSVKDDKAAGELAAAQLRMRQERNGEVEAELQGLPDLQPGDYIDFVRISPKINGRLYIVSVSHRMDEETFKTTIRCRRNVD